MKNEYVNSVRDIAKKLNHQIFGTFDYLKNLRWYTEFIYSVKTRLSQISASSY